MIFTVKLVLYHYLSFDSALPYLVLCLVQTECNKCLSKSPQWTLLRVRESGRIHWNLEVKIKFYMSDVVKSL